MYFHPYLYTLLKLKLYIVFCEKQIAGDQCFTSMKRFQQMPGESWSLQHDQTAVSSPLAIAPASRGAS